MDASIPLIAGGVSTAIYASGVLPMMVKAGRTKDLSSYSLGNLSLANAGNVINSIYVLSLPIGPIWFLHSFYVVTTALMLIWYVRYPSRQSRALPLIAPELQHRPLHASSTTAPTPEIAMVTCWISSSAYNNASIPVSAGWSRKPKADARSAVGGGNSSRGRQHPRHPMAAADPAAAAAAGPDRPSRAGRTLHGRRGIEGPASGSLGRPEHPRALHHARLVAGRPTCTQTKMIKKPDAAMNDQGRCLCELFRGVRTTTVDSARWDGETRRSPRGGP